jgi:hypothetical protein
MSLRIELAWFRHARKTVKRVREFPLRCRYRNELLEGPAVRDSDLGEISSDVDHLRCKPGKGVVAPDSTAFLVLDLR